MLMALVELEFTMAAIKAVMVVPMFAPKIKGAAFFMETIRFATRGTTTEVVIVEDRMAAVVVTPQKNALSLFLKNRSLNFSGDRVSSNSEINFLKIRIDKNSKKNERIAKMKPFGMDSTRKSINVVKPDQVGEKPGS